MPSRSWMPRSEYGLELGLRGSECAGQGWVLALQSQVFLSSLAAVWSGRRRPFVSVDSWPLVSQRTKHLWSSPNTGWDLMSPFLLRVPSPTCVSACSL